MVFMLLACDFQDFLIELAFGFVGLCLLWLAKASP